MKFFLKMTICSMLALLIYACSSESFSKESQNKGKLFIIGGGSRPASLVQAMIDESGLTADTGYGIVLPMASSVPDTSAYYGMLQFQERGINNVSSFNFADSTLANIPAKLDSVRNATLIYIPGGVQSRFMKAVQQTSGLEGAIKEAYANGALVAGTSAGAAVMSKIMITGDQKKYPEYTSTFYHLEDQNIITDSGLGMITGVIVDQHFIKRARNNRLLTAVMEYPDHIGIGIDESTAIVVHHNEAKVVGESQVLVYRNQSDSSVIKNGKMGARKIMLNIYLPGDSFTIR